MTPHNHSRFIPGCVRCELGLDEAGMVRCPECKGEGTIVRSRGEYEYDNKYPCPTCAPWPGRALRGPGVVAALENKQTGEGC